MVAAEETSHSGEAETEQEKGEADAEHKEQRIEKDGFSPVAHSPGLVDRARATRKIAYIQRYKREHAGREEAQNALQKNGECGNADVDVKSHMRYFLSIVSWDKLLVPFSVCFILPDFSLLVK